MEGYLRDASSLDADCWQDPARLHAVAQSFLACYPVSDGAQPDDFSHPVQTAWLRDGVGALNLKQGRLAVNRSKNSLSTEQPLAGDELRAIKRYLATREDKLPWLFLSEREQPMTRQAVNYLIGEAGERAKLGRVWPHMLRHSCGYALANKGADFRVIQDYLGHRDPRHTVRYTRTSARRFEGLWD